MIAVINNSIKLYLVILFWIISHNIYAAYSWEDSPTNICSPYPDIVNNFCPPINSNLSSNTCLSDIGSAGIIHNLIHSSLDLKINLCVEPIASSSYFVPKLRLRYQICDAYECNEGNQILQGHGDCKIVHYNPYTTDFIRVCSRIEDNSESKDISDIKFCAYIDNNSDLNFYRTGIEYFDASKFLQPWDSGEKLKWQDLITLTDQLSIVQVYIKNINTIYKNDILNMKKRYNLFFFAYLLNKYPDTLAVNKNIITATQIGCTRIPDSFSVSNTIFDNSITSNFIKLEHDYVNSNVIKTQRICEHNEQSKIDNPCVRTLSGTKNNIINNIVRVGYEYMLPLCNVGNYSRCVRVNPSSDEITSGIIDTPSIREQNYLSPVIDANSNNLKNTSSLILSNIKRKSIVSKSRLVYSVRFGGQFFISHFFFDDVNLCQNNSDDFCQELWGVNLGDFKDIILKFPAEEDSHVNTPLEQSFTLRDNMNAIKDFSASITRSAGIKIEYNDFRQDPNYICVFDIDTKTVVGCEPRANIVIPKIYKCGDTTSPIVCDTSDIYYEPKFIASISQDTNITSTIVTTNTSRYPTNTRGHNNLAGYIFDSFVTDESYRYQPFDGIKSIGPSTIGGYYKDLILDGTNSNVYLHGIEYLNGQYIRGGKYACLKISNWVPCSSNTTQCVLSKIVNNKVSNILSDRVFPDLPGDIKSYKDYFLSSDKFYNPNTNAAHISSNYGIRNKHPIEMGLCVEIPQPKCSEYTDDQGRIFGTSDIGTEVSGRYCVLDPNNLNVTKWTDADLPLKDKINYLIKSFKLGKIYDFGDISSSFPIEMYDAYINPDAKLIYVNYRSEGNNRSGNTLTMGYIIRRVSSGSNSSIYSVSPVSSSSNSSIYSESPVSSSSNSDIYDEFWIDFDLRLKLSKLLLMSYASKEMVYSKDNSSIWRRTEYWKDTNGNAIYPTKIFKTR
ncbi:hypothetical protein [Rickettsia endosymbiont of Cardiosporidium cionae]|uniref:hypothetical protein n=1 Tax=Rickettsia endosymbiont of Cardiosporidium cionae TaxID=2777155 RepID=UPI001895BC82|nr:hypothetical protein [Rickettsia endosymbiont of Cardiosporidium cionae]KAF8818223.1 hypothetical protein IHI24_000680 [Rickettsia endosymbiont of Cardiosporidium cionae]